MKAAADHMGFSGHLVVDDKAIPDGPWEWNLEPCEAQINTYLKQLKESGFEVGTIVTFDDGGVSHHPNHISTSHACVSRHKNGSDQDLYTLLTVPMYRKYNSFLDIFLSSDNEVNFFLMTPIAAVRALMLHHT